MLVLFCFQTVNESELTKKLDSIYSEVSQNCSGGVYICTGGSDNGLQEALAVQLFHFIVILVRLVNAYHKFSKRSRCRQIWGFSILSALEIIMKTFSP